MLSQSVKNVPMELSIFSVKLASGDYVIHKAALVASERQSIDGRHQFFV